MKRCIWVLIAGLLGIAMTAGAGKGQGEKPRDQNRHQNRCSLRQELRRLPLEHVDGEEAADLVYLLEEEKLARDVYLTSFELHGLSTFRRIAGNEKSHMTWALALVGRYGLQDPIADNGIGVFTDPGLQSLYESLTETGAASVESALLVGAAIEELDINDLRKALERSNNEDLDTLYQNLLKGSRNHLRVFAKALAEYGVTFEPTYLSPEEYREIVESPQEGGVVDAAGERLCVGAGKS